MLRLSLHLTETFKSQLYCKIRHIPHTTPLQEYAFEPIKYLCIVYILLQNSWKTVSINILAYNPMKCNPYQIYNNLIMIPSAYCMTLCYEIFRLLPVVNKATLLWKQNTFHVNALSYSVPIVASSMYIFWMMFLWVPNSTYLLGPSLGGNKCAWAFSWAVQKKSEDFKLKVILKSWFLLFKK